MLTTCWSDAFAGRSSSSLTGEELVVHQRLRQRHLVEGVVLDRAAEACQTTWGDPRTVDVDVAELEEDVDRAQRVLLTEAQAAESGHTDLRAEQRQPGHQRVSASGTAQLVGGVGHRADLPGLRAQARVDVLRGRSMQHV